MSFAAWCCPLSNFYVASIFFIISKGSSMVPDLLDRFLFARLSEVRSVPRIFEHGKSVPSLKHSNEMNLVIHSIIVRELSYLYFFYTHGSQDGLIIVRTVWLCAYVLSSPFHPLLYSLSYPETAERFLQTLQLLFCARAVFDSKWFFKCCWVGRLDFLITSCRDAGQF